MTGYWGLRNTFGVGYTRTGKKIGQTCIGKKTRTKTHHLRDMLKTRTFMVRNEIHSKGKSQLQQIHEYKN
jgi:hypothetical protein